MRIQEIKGRAVHDSGKYRVDRRPGTSPMWEYQGLALMDIDDGPEWYPVDVSEIGSWPRDGWNSVEDWV